MEKLESGEMAMRVRDISIAFMVASTAPALAADAPGITASSMASVITALQAAGYKAAIKTNKSGKLYVSSATNGSDYSIDFYNCDNDSQAVGCKTLMFSTWWKAKPYLTIAVANKFNSTETFGRAYIDKEQDLVLEMPVTTVGGLTLENFKDVVDWWSVVDADMSKAVDAAIEAAKKPGTAG